MKIDIWDVKDPEWKDNCAPVSYDHIVAQGGIAVRIVAQAEYPPEQDKLWGLLKVETHVIPPGVKIEEIYRAWDDRVTPWTLGWVTFHITHTKGEHGPCYEAAGNIISQAGRLITAAQQAEPQAAA